MRYLEIGSKALETTCIGVRHIANKCVNHPDAFFPNCSHEEHELRRWIQMGTCNSISIIFS